MKREVQAAMRPLHGDRAMEGSRFLTHASGAGPFSFFHQALVDS